MIGSAHHGVEIMLNILMNNTDCYFCMQTYGYTCLITMFAGYEIEEYIDRYFIDKNLLNT